MENFIFYKFEKANCKSITTLTVSGLEALLNKGKTY